MQTCIVIFLSIFLFKNLHCDSKMHYKVNCALQNGAFFYWHDFCVNYLIENSRGYKCEGESKRQPYKNNDSCGNVQYFSRS